LHKTVWDEVAIDLGTPAVFDLLNDRVLPFFEEQRAAAAYSDRPRQ